MARQKEGRILRGLLDEAELPYTYDHANQEIIVDFQGDDGATIQLVAWWEKDYIYFSTAILELDENDDEELPSAVLVDLLKLNAELLHSKFCIQDNVLCIRIDCDAHDISVEQLNVGILNILEGVDLFVDVIINWIRQSENANEISAHLAYLALESGREDLVADFGQDKDFVDVDSIEAEPKGQLGFISKALVGVGKFALKGAALGGLGMLFGVPGAAIGAGLAGLASSKN